MSALQTEAQAAHVTAALEASLGRRAVRVLDWLSVPGWAACLIIGWLQARRVDAGWLTSYGGDALGPVMLWWGLRRTAFARRRHAAEEAAALVLAGCWAWEWCQRFDLSGTPLGVTAGVFDPVDLVVYAAVMIGCYVLDTRLQHRSRTLERRAG